MSLDGRTIVVTGAASGIGAEASAHLMTMGAEVIGIDRHEVHNATTSHVVDLRDPLSIDQLIEALPNDIMGLANIAGLPPTAAAGDVIKVNLKAVQRLTIGLIPKMARGASIVNLASSAGNRWPEAIDQIMEIETVPWDDVDDFALRHGMETSARSYFFSKEALLVWTMRNRWTWQALGIRINAISPGPVDTPILGDFVATLGPRAQQSIDATERVGTPADIAPVIGFLLSDESGWFRGANLTPDGGLSAFMMLRDEGLA